MILSSTALNTITLSISRSMIWCILKYIWAAKALLRGLLEAEQTSMKFRIMTHTNLSPPVTIALSITIARLTPGWTVCANLGAANISGNRQDIVSTRGIIVRMSFSCCKKEVWKRLELVYVIPIGFVSGGRRGRRRSTLSNSWRASI